MEGLIDPISFWGLQKACTPLSTLISPFGDLYSYWLWITIMIDIIGVKQSYFQKLYQDSHIRNNLIKTCLKFHKPNMTNTIYINYHDWLFNKSGNMDGASIISQTKSNFYSIELTYTNK